MPLQALKLITWASTYRKKGMKMSWMDSQLQKYKKKKTKVDFYTEDLTQHVFNQDSIFLSW